MTKCILISPKKKKNAFYSNNFNIEKNCLNGNGKVQRVAN